MAGGLRYETGRDMPPGMQELTADQFIRQLRDAAAVAATTPIPEAITAPPVPGEPLQTNGDRIRAMSDEALTEKLFWAYQVSCEHDCGDISSSWCDLQGGCVGAGGEELACDEDKHKACILRWLRDTAKEAS